MAKVYTDKEINDAKNAGVFLKNPTPATTTATYKPKATLQYSEPVGPTQDANNLFSPAAASKPKKVKTNTDKIQEALEANRKAQEQQKAIDTQKYIADNTNYLNQLTEAQKASRTNALKDAYNKSLTGLDTQANTAKTNVSNTVSTLRQRLNELVPQFQQNRNQLSAQSAQDEQVLREQAARDGNIFGGQYIKNSVGLKAGLQRGINDQNLAETNLRGDYANQENVLNSNLATQLNNIAANKQQLTDGYGNNEQAIIKEVEAAKLAELMNLRNRGMDYDVQNNQLARSDSQQAFANAMAAINAASNIDNQNLANELNRAQVTGYYNPNANAGDPTVNYDPNNIQATIDQLKAINPNDPNIAALENVRYGKIMSDPTLRNQYGDQYKTTQQKQVEARQKAEQEQQAQQAELYKLQLEAAQLTNQINRIKADPNSPLNQLELQQAQADLAYKQRMIDEVGSRIAENNAQTSKIYSTPVSNNSRATDKNITYQDILDRVSKMKGETSTSEYTDSVGGTKKVNGNKYTNAELANYIIDSGLNDEEVARMLRQLSIPESALMSNYDKGKLLGKW